VFCVDYGFEKLVDFENAWDIHPSLLHLPFQVNFTIGYSKKEKVIS
jgi:Tudor domain